MNASLRWTRRLAFVPLLAAVALLSACDDDPTNGDDDPGERVESFRITIAGNSGPLTLNASGTPVSGPNPLIVSGTRAITVEFLDASGNSLNSQLEGDFEARIESANGALVTFARTGAFAGTVTRMGVGTTQLRISLYHTEENHVEQGPFNVSVLMQ